MVLRVSYNLLIIGSSCLLNIKNKHFFLKKKKKGFIEDHKLNYSKMHFWKTWKRPNPPSTFGYKLLKSLS